MAKNNNIRYINQKNNSNNQINFSQNMAMMKQLKSNNHKQIYLEGELNNFMNVQPNINAYSNINKQKERNVNYNIQNNANNYNNYIQRISNGERIKNNRGMPKKSPIPVQKSNMPGKYLNSSNMSTISRFSNNTYNASYHMADSQLLNNMSQISGYSNFSQNSQFSHGPFLDNNRTRPYSNNSRTILSKHRKNNGIISYKRNNSNQNIKRSNNIKPNNNFNNMINNNISAQPQQPQMVQTQVVQPVVKQVQTQPQQQVVQNVPTQPVVQQVQQPIKVDTQSQVLNTPNEDQFFDDFFE
jgi:hypothetical protein